MRRYRRSPPSCRKCKSRRIPWLIRRISRSGIKLQREIVLSFPVSLQWFQVLVPWRAATNACFLTRVFGHQFSTFDSHRDRHQGNHNCAPQRGRGSVQQATGSGTLFARDDEQNRDTIPMPTFEGRLSTVSATIPVEFPQNSLVGPQKQQISGLQFDKFPDPQSFLVWKMRFKNQVTTCSDFSIGCYVMDQRSGDGWLIGRIEVLAISLWTQFSKFREAGR